MPTIPKVSKTVHQGLLERLLRQLFPNEDIKSNVRREAKIINPDTGFPLEIDIWIPKLKLCFEFQDAYHYITSHDSQLPLDYIQKKDSFKRDTIENRGETLIHVPYWWDGKIESLVATIKKYRPELVTDCQLTSLPIPEFAPDNLLQVPSVPHVGELMLASFPLSLQFKQSISAIDSWWMGEKYDGVRCCWVPVTSTLYSRHATIIEISQKMKLCFPPHFLDGEIWCGRGFYTDSQKVNFTPQFVNWSALRNIVFDDPEKGANEEEFEKRYENILSYVSLHHPFITIAARVMCTSKHILTSATKEIIEDKGEGVILRKPKSVYSHGRSSHLLKLKAARGDREALVVGFENNDLLLQLPEGVIFSVSESDLERKPQIGEIVSFAFEQFSKLSIPVNPRVYRIRKDMTWQDVVLNAVRDSREEKQDETTKTKTGMTKPQGYWMVEKGKNQRKSFENFVRKRKCDPLDPESWYPITRSEYLDNKELRSILSYYNNNVIKALMNLFPEIGLQPERFSFQPRSYWKDTKNRRKLFTDLATEMGFDPLVAENWYNVSSYSVLSCKGADAVLFYYTGSVTEALIHLFPEIGFDRSLFSSTPRNYWTLEENRKKLFLSFAKDNNFDPLVAENWYSVSQEQFRSFKGASSALVYYQGNFAGGLVKLFPNIGLDKSRLQVPFNRYWQDIDHRRKVFDKYAETHGFDPLIASNWYNVPDLGSNKSTSTVVNLYDGSWVRALLHLYPEIGLDKFLFKSLPRNHWLKKENRREFFDRFAQSIPMNPLIAANWYSITKEKLMRMKGASSVLKYYNASLTNALNDLYPSIGLENHKFAIPVPKPKIDESNRKELFYAFARRGNFDPLVADHWYSITKNDILSIKGASTILKYYGGFIKGLMAAFPDIGLDDTKFSILPKNYWQSVENRRELFCNFAEVNGFDPLDPNNWYSVTKKQLLSFKNAGSVLIYYNNSVASAVQDLFGELLWDPSKFTISFTNRNTERPK